MTSSSYTKRISSEAADKRANGQSEPLIGHRGSSPKHLGEIAYFRDGIRLFKMFSRCAGFLKICYLGSGCFLVLDVPDSAFKPLALLLMSSFEVYFNIDF